MKFSVEISPFILLFTTLFAIHTQAQDMAGLEQGIKPYGAYHGGDIDSISMVNGSLTLHIPLISYPQRGGKLHLGLSLRYTTPSLSSKAGQTTCPSPNVCYPMDIHYIPNSPYGGDLQIVPDFYPSGASPNYLNSNIPICFGNGEPYDGGCGYPDPIFEDYSIADFTGALHHLGQTGTNSWVSRDATGYSINTTVTPANTLVLTDREGTQYSYMAYPPPTEVLNSGATQVGPPIWGPIVKIEDTNGNFMTANYTATGSGSGTTYTPTGWTDTLGRTIPWGVPATSMPGLPGPGGGKSPITISSTNLSFSFPKAVGPTCSTPFGPLCVVQGYSNNEIQSVELPNGTAYTFAYDPVTGALSQITLPTGGTISYTWTTSAACSGPAGIASNPTYSLQVTSRTVDAHDGTPPQTWHYAIGSSSIVTDPLGNDTVHVMTALGPQVCANVYETEKDTYAGSYTSGTLLEKTVTTYHSDPDPYILANSQEYNSLGGISGLAMNVVPQSVTTTDVASGKTTEVTKSYDAGIALSTNPVVNAIFGDVILQNEYDFGSGSPGSLIRQTKTTYMALSGPNASSYLANNLLDLPYTVQVNSAGGTQASYIQYNYDQSSPASSGLTASASFDTSPAAGTYRGNNTSIVRWLNAGAAVCPNGTSPGSGSVTTQQSYFNTGMVDVATDPCGHTTTYGYSMTYQGAFPTTLTNALGQSDTYGYEFNTGLRTSAEDANSKTTSYGYDNSWRLTAVGYPDGGATTYCYSDLSTTQCPGAVSVPSVLFTKTQSPDPSLQIELDVDGLGRKIKQRTLSDVQGVDYVDTAYDPLGRVASVSNPYRSVSDPTYGSTRYTYDALSRKTAETEADGSTLQWCYNGVASMGQTICQPNRSSVASASWIDSTDEVGNPNQRASDALGRLRAVMEPQSGGTVLTMETDYSYDTLNNLTSVIQHGLSTDTARTRTFLYDSLSRLLWSQNPENGVVCYGQGDGTLAGCQTNGYDAAGNLLYKTDARGVTTGFSYDQVNDLVAKSYSGSSSAAAAIAAGTPPSSFVYGTTSSSVANGVGRLVTEFTGPSDAPITQRSIVAYDPMGRIKQETQCVTTAGCGSTSDTFQYSYDVAGNRITSINGVANMGIGLTYGYDGVGRLQTVTSTWDDDSHPAGLFAPQGTSPQYGPAGLSTAAFGVSSSTQQATYALQRTYDTRMRVTAETDYQASAPITTVGSTGSITVSGVEKTMATPTPATGTITISGIEMSHQVCPLTVSKSPAAASASSGATPLSIIGGCETEPDLGTLSVNINGAWYSASCGGSSTDATMATALANALSVSGSPVTAVASGDVVTMTSIATGTAANYTYTISNGADIKGTASGSALTGGSPGATVYDTGMVTASVNGIASSPVSWGQNFTSTNLASALASAIQSVAGAIVTAGPVTTTNNTSTIPLQSTTTGASTNYVVSVNVTDSTPGIGSPSFTITPASMTGGGEVALPAGTIYSYGLSYMPNSNIQSVNDSVVGMWGYSYDSLNRLTTAQASANSQTGFAPYGSAVLSWGYDSFGNEQGEALSGSTPLSLPQVSHTYTGYSLLNGVAQSGVITNQMDGYNYDASGDLLYDNISSSYSYDAEGRVASVDGTISYLYDAEGRRVAKLSGGTLTNQYLLGLDGEQISELDGQGNWLRSNVYANGRLLATYNPAGLHFHFEDWLGTRRVQGSGTGIVEQSCQSLPFGDALTCTGTDATPLHFTGKERDAESGLDYFGARYYASNMGRWMSPDWADKPEAVPYSSLSDPQTLNLYGYMRNNPLGGTDKDGHCGQQQSGGTTCPTVTVTATPATQPAPVHTTTVTDTQGNQHTVTGPNADIHFTVSTNGTPAAGVKVTETNQSTTQAGTQTINGKPIEGSATSNASGGYKDTVGAGLPSSTTTPAAAASAYNSTPVTITDTQTQTLTLPGGCTCTATSTRVVTNTTDGKTISPGGYTLTTTQPVVSTPKPPQQPQ